MMAEEWTWAQRLEPAPSTIGLNTVTVDIANKAAHVTPAIGQSGYEKLMPLNPQSTEHVVIVAAGYNYGYEPAPLKVYVGVKGKNADGTAGTGFLARNGLAFGKLYGLAITDATVTTLGLDPANKYSKTEFMEKYLADASAPDKFDAKFFPTSYQYDGNVVNVDETEVLKWVSDSEQPSGYVFFNGDTKTEHPAADPGSKSRWVQSMTDDGAYLAIDLPNLAAELPAGALPTSLTAKVVRLIGAWDGSMKLATRAVGANGESASKHIEKDVAKPVAPDGLAWIQGSDGIVLVVDEDSGNDWGDRKYALQLGEDCDGDLKVTGSYLLAIGGGPETKRGQAKVSALTGTDAKLCTCVSESCCRYRCLPFTPPVLNVFPISSCPVRQGFPPPEVRGAETGLQNSPAPGTCRLSWPRTPAATSSLSRRPRARSWQQPTPASRSTTNSCSV